MRPSPSRRGVLLLLILALLAMFGLIAVAFVVLTGHAQRGAKSIERLGLTDSLTDSTASKTVLQQAAMQVFRGSTSPASVMGAHSLLEDIYGNGWVTGRLNAPATPVCGNQLLEITFYPAEISAAELARRGGCVLTITGPNSATPGYGQSTRIVGFNPTNGNPQILAFPDGTVPQQDTVFSINGAPFSGTGFGYNPDPTTGGTLNLAYDPTDPSKLQVNPTATMWPVALLPNLPLSYYGIAPISDVRNNPPGGANSDYTAADFQHMLLAAQVPIAGPPASVQTLPSFHRPALINYWLNNPTPTNWPALWAASPDLCRKILMRPIGQMTGLANPDHPNFTGGNPNFNPAWNGAFVDSNGDGICDYQWDVDNDGDGVADSVWVDLGLPVRATSDGRLYKPLFAILCTDLDGRLNVNAHGCLAQAGATYPEAASPPTNYAFASNAVDATVALPRGVGYSPAEINLSPILGGNATLYTQLLTDRYPSGGLGSDVGSHRLNLNKWFLYGGNYWNGAANDTGAYGSPPDLAGTAALGVDYGGRPLYGYVGTAPTMGQDISTAQCPYEFDLSTKKLRGASATPGNVPYSAAELERILRPYDRDATSLPARLAQATAVGGVASNSALLTPATRRNSVTTDSWDVPVPSAALAKEILVGSGALDPSMQPFFPPKHVTDVLKLLLIKQTNTLTSAQLDTLLPELFPPELLAGRKMDLNRAFGDGRDNATVNDVVDEPGEANSALSFYTSATGSSVSGTMTYDPRGAVTGAATTSLEARQLYARYLYVLAMLLADRTALTTEVTAIRVQQGLPAVTADDVARFVAQWAVNVVDFYDRDSIMTPFIFNPTPFTTTGWDSTTYHLGLPVAGDTHVVWGCERPELLITETLALHDRRVENVPVVAGGPTWYEVPSTTVPSPSATSTPPWKNTFSQRARPQGSLFIELYSPQANHEPLPRELSDNTGSGIVLSKVVPSTTCPIWRLVIVPGTAATTDADPENGTVTSGVFRSIYFTTPPAAPTPPATPSDGTERFYTTTPTPAIQPGRYAVVGPTGATYLGRRGATDPTDNNQTRQIRMTPAFIDPGTTIVGTGSPVRNNLTAGSLDVLDTELQTSILIPITSSRPNISEPDGGYTAGGTLPRPIDYDRTSTTDPNLPASVLAAARTNGTTRNVAIVHLQRLANPLQTYDQTTNPYRTIDSMPIDLIAFNGWDSVTISGNTTRFGDEVPNGYWGCNANPGGTTPVVTPGITTSMMVATHQRGEMTAALGANNLWTETLAVKTLTVTSQDAFSTHQFPYVLQHSLGFMNQSLAFPGRAATYSRLTSGTNRGDPAGSAATPSSPPFPWMTWNNRPFISQLELTQVPWTKSSQLCRFFTTAPATPNPYTTYNEPFGNLLNLFQSAPSAPGGTTTELHRILEFVGVPSRFVGTEIQVNPTVADGIFHTPFNRIPTLREPGKINLNTIFSEEVYNGLLNNNAYLGPTWANFQLSRRGYAAAGIDDAYPTRFARPFRSFGGANLAPLTNLVPSREVNATLLREGVTAVMAPTGQPLFSFTQGGDYNNTTRNPFFYYHAMQRLGNLVTTRSNVYAVWITVGYFEAVAPPFPAPAGAVHPDGFALGRELGTDTGEIDRHRAFYIFDRTLPVGFQRGQDLNVDKAILVNRFIE